MLDKLVNVGIFHRLSTDLRTCWTWIRKLLSSLNNTLLQSSHAQSLYFKAHWYCSHLITAVRCVFSQVTWLYEALAHVAWAYWECCCVRIFLQNLPCWCRIFLTFPKQQGPISWGCLPFVATPVPSSWAIVIRVWILAWQSLKLVSPPPTLQSLAVISSNGDARLWSLFASLQWYRQAIHKMDIRQFCELHDIHFVNCLTTSSEMMITHWKCVPGEWKITKITFSEGFIGFHQNTMMDRQI